MSQYLDAAIITSMTVIILYKVGTMKYMNAGALFVEVMLCVIFLDGFLVGLLKVLAQDDVAVLTHSLHSSLAQTTTATIL